MPRHAPRRIPGSGRLRGSLCGWQRQAPSRTASGPGPHRASDGQGRARSLPEPSVGAAVVLSRREDFGCAGRPAAVGQKTCWARTGPEIEAAAEHPLGHRPAAVPAALEDRSCHHAAPAAARRRSNRRASARSGGRIRDTSTMRRHNRRRSRPRNRSTETRSDRQASTPSPGGLPQGDRRPWRWLRKGGSGSTRVLRGIQGSIPASGVSTAIRATSPGTVIPFFAASFDFVLPGCNLRLVEMWGALGRAQQAKPSDLGGAIAAGSRVVAVQVRTCSAIRSVPGRSLARLRGPGGRSAGAGRCRGRRPRRLHHHAGGRDGTSFGTLR